jgi:putative hemolysin
MDDATIGTSSVMLELLVIFVLILVNGWLAMAEMAMVSSKSARLQQLARDGNRGAKRALELLASPADFLAAVQLGITVIGVAAGAFGGATLAEVLARAIARWSPFFASYADAISIAAVVLMITMMSLVIGELVPKRLALARPEERAASSARIIRRLTNFARPGVRVLAWASDLVLKILGVEQPDQQPVTQDEMRILLEQGTAAGVFTKTESTMIKRVMRLPTLRVDALMTPRVKIIGLDLDDPLPENLARIVGGDHHYYPIYRGDWHDLAGVIPVKDVVAMMMAGQTVDLKRAAITPLYLSESVSVARALDRFKQSGTHVALVIDEFGTVAGMLTLTDALEAIVGELPEGEGDTPGFLRRDDGSWLIDGRFPLNDLRDTLGVRSHALEQLDAQTIGGLVMQQLGRIPREGDRFVWEGLKFEVVDMDGRRVDKVIASRPSSKDKDKEKGRDKNPAGAAGAAGVARPSPQTPS